VLVDKRREYNSLHTAFVDHEKAFNRVNRQKLWKILPSKGTPMNIGQVIKSLYEETLICVAVGNKVGNKRMTTNQGVRQGCSLSTALFNIYLDEMLDSGVDKYHQELDFQKIYTLKLSYLLTTKQLLQEQKINYSTVYTN
jgi:hypothetical protein